MQLLRSFPAATVVTLAAVFWTGSTLPGQDEPEKASTHAILEIEQLAVGNYWTTKETTFDREGGIISEAYSTAAVVGKKRLGGRVCFKFRQFGHEGPRFDTVQLELNGDNENPDEVSWEFLENGNLYHFDRVEEEVEDTGTDLSAGGENFTAEDLEAPGDPSTAKLEFTASNPALYLKYPAQVGDLFQSFNTVGRVMATSDALQTPAGRFNCYAYGFLTDGSEPLPHRSYTLEYWCPGTGFVKLEEYEIDGTESRLTYTMELISYHLEDVNPGPLTEEESRRSKIENVR